MHTGGNHEDALEQYEAHALDLHAVCSQFLCRYVYNPSRGRLIPLRSKSNYHQKGVKEEIAEMLERNAYPHPTEDVDAVQPVHKAEVKTTKEGKKQDKKESDQGVLQQALSFRRRSCSSKDSAHVS